MVCNFYLAYEAIDQVHMPHIYLPRARACLPESHAWMQFVVVYVHFVDSFQEYSEKKISFLLTKPNQHITIYYYLTHGQAEIR